MKRLQIYHNETEPILGKYSEKVKKINASDNPQAIFERVVETLSK
jgi:adenylate kinase family enzyme